MSSGLQAGTVSQEKGLQRTGNVLGHFFRQIMTTGQFTAFHGVVRYLTPGIEHVIVLEHWVGIAPQHQKRALDFSSGLPVITVVRQIN